jgi:two-component system, OmpR family, copper resistance phosphate regulon response regulator CusR
MSKILLVEDDSTFAEDLSTWLRREAHVVEIAKTGVEGIELLKAFPYDIVILDWALPDLDGVSVCKLCRIAGGKAPILMLTGKAEIENKELGLDSGADDYMVKPPDFRELSARLRALLRRNSGQTSSVLKLGDIVFMLASRKVTRAGEEIDLTPKEYAVLEFLARHKGVVFSADQLLERVWNSDTEASSHTVRVCINRLRQKVFSRPGPPVLKTIYGVGYLLE